MENNINMNKLSNATYQRLVAQAQEARELHQTELAEQVLGAVGATPREEGEDFVFSYAEMQNEVSKSLWKVAMEVISYHDAKKADIQKLSIVIEELTEGVIVSMEKVLNASNKIGANEEELPGVSKKIGR